jgi:hypothetical protein
MTLPLPLPWFAANRAGSRRRLALRPCLHPCWPRASSTQMRRAKQLAKPNGYRISKVAHGKQNEISDVKVMVYGNTRIATGAWTGKGVESDGSKVDSHERSTDGMGEDAGW